PAPVGTAAAAPPLWALQPPRPQPLPAVAEAGWCRDPIDRFVLARLDEKGLQPSPPADPATLLRRTALVLTGLPPSADAVAAFTAEPTDAAFARAIDLLLATPAYGERMAADWLDLARFADTYGYQADFDCRTWPWRDWVISAFNSDMQYDRFATEQLAGDLLPDASVSSRLATAFCRLHRQTNEGGSIDAEWRQEYIADRVDTFGTAFLGLTLGCARCHDHKFDPISQRDYYALGSFFAIDDSGLYPYSTGAVPRPSLRLASAEQELELARLRAGVAAAEQQLLAVRERSAAGAAAWLASTPLPDVPPPLAHYPFDLLAAGKTEDSCRQDQPAAVAAGVTACAGLAGGAVQFDGDGGVTVPGLPAFSRDDAFSLTFALWCPDHKERAVVLHTSQYTEDADTQGYQVLLQDGRLCWQIVHYWPGAAIALRTCAELPLQRWVRVAVSYDGSSRADGMAVYLDGLRVATEVERDGLDGAATVRTLQLGARDRDRGLQGGRLDELAVWDRCLCAFEVCEQQQRAAGVPTPRLADPEAQREFYLAVIDPEMRAARADLRAARAALHGCADAIPEIMVMAAHPLPPPRYVLKRGAYDQPDPSQPVQPDVPAAVMPFGARPRDRAGLAAWLCGARQPLFARVATNRLWALCFGRGLVATPENFGRLGEPPSHPELLDQLACDFIAADYHCKSLLRRIVLSATFRQQSGCSSALRERDPDNRLLARGPSFRLPAETLRDQALLAAGLLHQQVGGPSAKPWQPP
ncbi:MAG TPA: DUF1549 domain-containing protein, partial [Planctomycetota bacterium]|nr:DUF1549 domain-containing protein [Planctomycetota bacterium]